MSDRGYKVVYKSRASDSTDDQLSPQRSRRDNRYHDDDFEARRDRDAVSTRSANGSTWGGRRRGEKELTKTTYAVGRSRNDDVYIKGGNAVVIDQPRRRRGESESEWEVIQPERNSDGAYVIDMGGEGGRRRGGRSYDFEVDMPGRRSGGELIEIGGRARGRESDVLAPPTRRDRSVSRGMIEAMQQVQVTEDYSSEEDRRSRVSRRGRSIVERGTTAATGAATLRRAPSAIRRDHSSSSDTNRRSRSVGFRNRDVINHDASESRHERPGAEAHLAGMYLVDHRGEYVRRGEGNESIASGTRSRTDGYDRYGAEVEKTKKKGYYRDEKSSYEDYEREGHYEPQRAPRRHHHHSRHKHRDDDDESRYSEYYEKKMKKYY